MKTKLIKQPMKSYSKWVWVNIQVDGEIIHARKRVRIKKHWRLYQPKL